MDVIAPQLPQSALEHWQLGPVSQVKRVPTGLLNKSWRVEAASGTYLLKLFKDVTGPTLQFQFRVLHTLGSAGVPVVLPIPSIGRTPTIILDGHELGVFPWVAGRHRSGLAMSHSACRHLGAVIGQMHRALHMSVPPSTPLQEKPQQTNEQALRRVDELLELVSAGRGDETGFERMAEQTLRLKRGWLVRLADRRPPDTPSAVTGYIHGDLHPHNVMHGPDDSVVALLDWDRLTVGSYAKEMVRSAIFYFTYGDERGLDVGRIAAYAAGYRSVFDIGDAEIALASHQLWWDRMTDNWVIEWHYLRHNASCDHLLPGQTALIKWWTLHFAQVDHALRNIG
ncbi:phosphotransferase enzyme family protein [Natronoglycomyces albus]|uniref:Phosphotransferase n=1 Tax=Natronoglycomyces albus TaxID=2811108 RepID=A0A895XLU6_9ACTN|nr:phosphotransferase [Natronoglycomyces albus]QSB06661.1 phosphotransferase [Natronoglycomyces albus]